MQSKAPNLSALRAFEAAARLESFADAAAELCLTPAAISRAVRRLEEDLGLELFHRAHRSVSLTAAGARYAQKVTEAFRQLTPDAGESQSTYPKLTLDIEATFLRQWLLPRLRSRAFEALGMKLAIRVHHDPPRVIPAVADLAIVWGFADYSGFKRKRLVSPRTILVAAPELNVSSLQKAADLGLIHEADDHWWRLIFHEAGLEYPEDARELTLGRCDLPVEAARLGLGVCVADDVIAEQELKFGDLAPVPGPRLDSQDYYLMTRKSASVPAQAFAKWLLEEADVFSDWQAAFHVSKFPANEDNHI